MQDDKNIPPLNEMMQHLVDGAELLQAHQISITRYVASLTATLPIIYRHGMLDTLHAREDETIKMDIVKELCKEDDIEE